MRRTLLAAAILLASCGGGDTSTPTPPPAANQPPTFTSPAAVSTPENQTTVFTPATRDPEGAAQTVTIAGGADATRFTLTGGALTFAAPPDFEAPGDADANNVYLVQLRVSDGTLATTQDVAITVTNVAESFAARRVASGLSQPLYVAAIPGDTRVFMLEKGGRILLLDPATGATSTFMSVAGSISTGGERGLLGIAAPSGYQTDGVFFVYVTNTAGDIEVRRYRRSDANTGDPASGELIIRIPHPGFDNHNGGWLGFGPHDGLLYIATGDGGGSGDPNDNAQNLQSRLGKILRINPFFDDFPSDATRSYRIPADNPAYPGGAAPEIFAYGFRNPFRASFDGSSLYVGDVGQGAMEEIDLIRPADAGGNYGWPFREGTRAFRGTAPSGLRAPVAEYDHGTGPLQGRSVTGGYVHRGGIAALVGQYLFGDFVSGNIWTVDGLAQGSTAPSSRFVRRNALLVPGAGAINQVASFGEDAARNLYIVDFDGEVFQVVPAG